MDRIADSHACTDGGDRQTSRRIYGQMDEETDRQKVYWLYINSTDLVQQLLPRMQKGLILSPWSIQLCLVFTQRSPHPICLAHELPTEMQFYSLTLAHSAEHVTKMHWTEQLLQFIMIMDMTPQLLTKEAEWSIYCHDLLNLLMHMCTLWLENPPWESNKITWTV